MIQKHKHCFCYRRTPGKVEYNLRLILVILQIVKTVLVIYFLIAGA